MAEVINLNDLFSEMLKDVYYAEKKILKALPKMAKAIGKESKLAAAFEKHRQETEGQIDRLEQVFEIIGKKARGKKCEAIEGLSKEAEELMDEVACGATLEAGLLAGAQAVEHYEIARYGTLIEWARLLGYKDAVKLLTQTLDEEKKTDELLSKMALGNINQRALDAQQEESEDDKESLLETIRRKIA
ncbi:MAG: ferritin-like domain-containing protein [Alphaproteobacteria bacterium]